MVEKVYVTYNQVRCALNPCASETRHGDMRTPLFHIVPRYYYFAASILLTRVLCNDTEGCKELLRFMPWVFCIIPHLSYNM